MKIIKPCTEIITPLDGDAILRHIELCGRVCYKSEDKITPDSSEKFVASLIKRGHESVLEHYSFTVRFVCDRGVSHELVRHRIASFSQESTRYCNYGNDDRGCTFIAPYFWSCRSSEYYVWGQAMLRAEEAYLSLINSGVSPQEARSVLPNSPVCGIRGKVAQTITSKADGCILRVIQCECGQRWTTVEASGNVDKPIKAKPLRDVANP